MRLAILVDALARLWQFTHPFFYLIATAYREQRKSKAKEAVQVTMHEHDHVIFQEIYRYREGHCRWPTHVAVPYAIRNEVAPYWLIPIMPDLSLSMMVSSESTLDLNTCPPRMETVRVERYVDLVGRYPTPKAITRIPPLLGDMAFIE